MSTVVPGKDTRQHGLLDMMANRLLLATTPSEQLDAVMSYPVLYRASAARLYYVNDEDKNRLTLVAEWTQHNIKPMGVGTQLTAHGFPDTSEAHIPPVMPMMFDDVSLLDAPQEIRDSFVQHSIAALVSLPLSNQGQWIAAFVFTWDKVQKFTERDQHVYANMIQQSTAAVHVLRLLGQSSRRAKELETANHELDLLYRASELLNLANSYQDVIEAVAPFDPDADTITLILWDEFDWQLAELGTVEAVIDRRDSGLLKTGDLLPITGFPIGDTMLGQKVWIFEDVRTDPRVDPVTAVSWDTLNIRAFMGPALYNGDVWMGGITYHSTVPRRYAERELRLFAAIGDQVSATVRRIHLQKEREKSRLRAEIMARINALLLQATDELEIVNAIASYTKTLDVQAMVLVYIDSDPLSEERWWRPVALWQGGLTTAYDAKTMPRLAYVNSELVAIWTANPYEVLFVEDIATDERLSESGRIEFMQNLPYRSVVAIPMVIGQQYLGILRIAWLEPRSFTDFERSIFQSLIRILPFVIATRRNYLSEQQRANELEVIARVSAAAANITDESAVLRTICNLANQQFEDYAVVVFLLDESKRHLEWFNDNEAASIAVSDDTSPAAFVARERNSIIINDIRSAVDYRLVPTRPDVRSMMALPVVIGEQFIGVLEIQCTHLYRFSTDDLRVMGTLADLIAVALQNARLYRQSMSYAVLEERNRLARELHDSVSQAMYGIALGARTARTMLDRDVTKLAEPLDYVLSLSEAGLAEMRALIFELRPETLEKEGLIEAISRQVEMMQSRHGLNVMMEINHEPQLPFKLKEALYWIVREALHNIIKHARASEVHIAMESTAEQIILKVSDNGIGFDTTAEYSGHMGLQSMRERCQQVGGELTMLSETGKGSHLTVTYSPRINPGASAVNRDA